MKIAVDARSLQKSKGKGLGVRRVLINILLNWLKSSPQNEYLLYFDDDDCLYDDQLLKYPCCKKRVVKGLSMLKYGLFWENFVLPFAVNKDKADVIFSPSYTTPILFTKIPRYVVVYDISYHRIKSGFSFRHRNVLNLPCYLSCLIAKKIITSSCFSRDEIVKGYGISSEKIDVIYCGIEDKFAPLSEEGSAQYINVQGKKINNGYLLYVGTMFNRRHIPELLSAYEHCLKQELIIDIVIVGVNKTYPQFDFKARIAEINKLAKRKVVIHFDFVEEEELLDLYQNCLIFLYPSSYEGFGFPPLEAMACGKPVITGNYSSLPEVVGDGAICVDPSKPGEICSALEKVMFDKEFSEGLIGRAISRSEKFKWDYSAKKYLNIIMGNNG